MLPFSLLLLSLDAHSSAPPDLSGACDAMWTNQPLEGYLGLAGPDGKLRSWSDPVPTEGVSVWVCASKTAYAWLWRVQPDNTPVLIWPLGDNVVPLDSKVPVMVPQASLIGAEGAHGLLLALSPSSTRPEAIRGFTFMSPDPGNVVHLTSTTWPKEVFWEPILLGPPMPGRKAAQ